jgi:hypothetical protein
MKKMITALMVLFVCYASYAQQSKYEVTIKKQFEESGLNTDKNIENLDTELIIKHTYPPLIELMGGKQMYIQLIQSASTMEEEEYEDDYEEEDEEGPWTLKESKVELSEIGKVYQSGDELQAVIEINEIDVYGDRDEILKRHQLAISRDGGIFWYFLDGTLEWDQVVPDLHKAIIKPEEKEETIFR